MPAFDDPAVFSISENLCNDPSGPVCGFNFATGGYGLDKLNKLDSFQLFDLPLADLGEYVCFKALLNGREVPLGKLFTGKAVFMPFLCDIGKRPCHFPDWEAVYHSLPHLRTGFTGLCKRHLRIFAQLFFAVMRIPVSVTKYPRSRSCRVNAKIQPFAVVPIPLAKRCYFSFAQLLHHIISLLNMKVDCQTREI